MKTSLFAGLALFLFACGELPSAESESLALKGDSLVDASYEVDDGAGGVTTRTKSCTQCRSGYATCCEWLKINGVWVQNCTTQTCQCYKFGTIAWCDYQPMMD